MKASLVKQPCKNGMAEECSNVTRPGCSHFKIRLGNNNKVNDLTSVLVVIIYRGRGGRHFIRPPHYGCQSTLVNLHCYVYIIDIIQFIFNKTRTKFVEYVYNTPIIMSFSFNRERFILPCCLRQRSSSSNVVEVQKEADLVHNYTISISD